MVTVQNNKKRFFKLDANLLKSGELGFFEKVMESAEELSINDTEEIGLITKKGQ